MDVPLVNQTLLFVVGFFQGPSLLPTTHNKVTTISDPFLLTDILCWYEVWLQSISTQTCLPAFVWLGFVSKEKKNRSNLITLLNPDTYSSELFGAEGCCVLNSFSYVQQRTEADIA